MLTIIPNKDTLNPTLSTNINLSSITPSATCSYTEPNSLVTGCLDSVQEAATNPGAQATTALGVGITGLKKGPLAATGEVLGLETLGACTYGAVNTAVDNCNATKVDVTGVNSNLEI